MNLDPQWIVGFVDGQGFFHVAINKNKEAGLGFQVQPEFTVVQHARDIQVLQALKDEFQCGVVRVNHGDRFAFRVRGHVNLRDRVLPFFEKHHLKTRKRQEFLKFRDVILLMEQKQHNTPEGLEKIRQIQATMNRKGASMKLKLDVELDEESEI